MKEKRKKKGTRRVRKQQNGNNYIPINNYFKCKWVKFTNQKTQSI